MSAQAGTTTIAVSQRTRKRLSRLKPHESMSYDELVNEMMDMYENE